MFGQDKTAMHDALIENYLGIPEIAEATGGWAVPLESGAQLTARYLVLSEGKGRSARPGRSQAIISAGDGAAAAIDILSRIEGEDVVDWDEPAKP